METTVPILIALTAAVLLCMGAILDDRRARHRRRAQREEASRSVPLLHSINDDRCIGCEACIDVCPTEVLDLVEHKVRVSRFSDCVQCEQCANVCPTQALVMYRQGTTPRMLTVPELDEHFQTGVPGQYLIGEVAGKPLVKNAANLGRAVIEHIARELAHRPAIDARGGRVRDVLDVVIVGSGPGGLSAGLACVKHRLTCQVLEKEHVISSTVARYPKGKHFMAEPCTSQNVSYLPVFDGSKEELVAAWTQVIEGVQLPIKLGEAVETVQRGDDGVFTIKSTVGTYRARTVVLATGLRGKPRLLAVPGANLEKVQSLLDDPAEFAGEATLVVGGGDSAVEGAIALAEVGASVTLSYRGDGFKRCKQGNQRRLAELVAAKQLTVLLESNVRCFTPDRVTIALADRTETTIANQRAFVLIGADTPVAWLEANQVRFVERPHLYALGSSEDVVRRFAPDAAECPRTPEQALAILLDRPGSRSPVRRVRSVVEHLRDELRDVVTSVSSVFRLPDVEPRRDPRPPGPRPPARDVAAIRRGRPDDDGTTDAVPSLRTLERAAGLAPRPFPPRLAPPAVQRRGPDEPTQEIASLRAHDQHTIDHATEEMPSLRTHEDLPWLGTHDDMLSLRTREDMLSLRTREDMPSLGTHESLTEAELLSLRALDGSIDSEALPLHTLEDTVVIACGSSDRSSPVLTSATRPAALRVRPDATPPRPPSRRGTGAPAPVRFARGSETTANPPATVSEPHRAPLADRAIAPARERASSVMTSATRQVAIPVMTSATRQVAIPAMASATRQVAIPAMASATRQVAIPVRLGAEPPVLPKRPSRLPRGSSLVKQRLTPTPTLARRQPVSAAPIEPPHAEDPADRPARETR
jgi:thioredoxin reductase/NAD-dependent dihydropyrimidine dehydrogenase PreA subunit